MPPAASAISGAASRSVGPFWRATVTPSRACRPARSQSLSRGHGAAPSRPARHAGATERCGKIQHWRIAEYLRADRLGSSGKAVSSAMEANDRPDRRADVRAHIAPALPDNSGGGRWRGTASLDRPTMGGLADPRRRRAAGTRRPTRPCCHRSGGRASGLRGNKVDLRPPHPLATAACYQGPARRSRGCISADPSRLGRAPA